MKQIRVVKQGKRVDGTGLDLRTPAGSPLPY